MGKIKELENPYAKDTKHVLEKAEIDESQGLSEEESGSRLKKYGPNKLQERKEKPVWKILLHQFTTSVMYLLAGAAVLSFSFGDLPEGIAIVVVMLINAAIGFGMEYKARQSMKALKEMDKITATVLRNGEEVEINAENIVPGDIVALKEGVLVPADLRILKVSELQINEAPLTGESVPIEKTTDKLEGSTRTADRTNMAFKGTSVTRGKGIGVAVATSMDTEIGNVSEMVSTAGQEDIPLNRKLNKLSKKLIYAVLGLAALLGVTGWAAGKEVYSIVQTSIAWAIAAIPEGLPIVASIALARGMLRLSKHNVIVKRLASVETLGETDTIFTDKTGTLTENKLTVDTITIGLEEKGKAQWEGENVEMEGLKTDTSPFEKMFVIAVLANDASYDAEADAGDGDPLEIALLRFASYFDKEKKEVLQGHGKIGEDPFDTESNRMGTVYKMDDRYFIAGKGAPESMLEICTKKVDNGEVTDFTEEEKKQVAEQNDSLANDGLRALAFAYREDRKQPDGIEDREFLHDMVYTGLIGFVDPPAKEVAAAIKTCKEAGIEVVMVTGDHPGTAFNIARQVHLVSEGENNAIHGKDLEEKELDNEKVVDTRVFSRVDPGQKLDLIGRFQEQNKIVGMTGDGVNDAPALKKADIGIAMGKRGTQVAKEVADLVLKDDAFESIVHAIREGRIIFGNIRKFVIYQLSYHFSEILVIAVVMLVFFELALLPLQLLYLNLLLDVFPALALGVGRGREEVMNEKPKDPKEAIITKRNWLAIGSYGFIIASVVSGVYFYGYYEMGLSFELCNNIAFFTLAFAQLVNVLNMRDPDENVFINQVTGNKYVWMAIVVCTAALLAAYFIPGLNGLLSLPRMGMDVWLLIIIGSLAPAFFIQIVKQLVKS